MYKEFFGLSEAPFSISPNPKFFYLSRHHREALASLKHGTGESGGFVLFTGEVGTGKTVIVRTLIQGFSSDIKYAAIYNPDLSVNEMLEAICQGFEIDFAPNSSKRELLDYINNFLVQCATNAKRAVLLIDEAQHLSDEVLEQVRLLTNFETNNTKLLQVVLVGQPELSQKLKQQHLRQLAQRITARFHLLPLTVTEVDSYIRFRLQSAGCLQVIFTRGAVEKVYSYSKGIPRIINVISDRALLAAYVDRSHTVESTHIKQAATEVLGIESLGQTTKNKLSSFFLWHDLVKYISLGILGVILGVSLGFITDAFDDRTIRTKVLDILKQDDELILAHTKYKRAQAQANKKTLLKRESSKYEADVLNSTLEESVWQNLLREWGFVDNTLENGGGIDDSCTALKTYGFRCLATKGSLRELENYNIPALIKINDEALTQYFAVLIGINSKHAVLLLNNREWVVSRTWLKEAMDGDYRLIWPLPGGEEMVKATSNKESQALLSQMLANYFMDSSLSFNGWNSAIAQKVREVQANNGLAVDGIAGIDTLWVLLPFANTGHTIKREHIEVLGEDKLNEERAQYREKSNTAEVNEEHDWGTELNTSVKSNNEIVDAKQFADSTTGSKENINAHSRDEKHNAKEVPNIELEENKTNDLSTPISLDEVVQI